MCWLTMLKTNKKGQNKWNYYLNHSPMILCSKQFG
ncbi:hypothetical protein [Gilliamella sp. Pra-s60]